MSEEAMARDGGLRLQFEEKLAELAAQVGVENEQLREETAALARGEEEQRSGLQVKNT